MRQLATIQKIERIDPIQDRDQIGLASVLGWKVIVRYDQFSVGDYCVYVEIDSKLPEREEFEFMRPKKFIVKTMKMAGVYSQGLCLPMSVLKKPAGCYFIGDDVTDELGITKYDPEFDAELKLIPNGKFKNKPISKFQKFMVGHKITRVIYKLFTKKNPERKAWPSFINKTDETRIQNMRWILNDKSKHYVVTEKVDGQSGTFFIHKRGGLRRGWEYGVCSRNLRLFTKDNSSYWSNSDKYNIENVLKCIAEEFKEVHPAFVCIQGECIGPGVQKNKYHVNDYDLYCFNLIVDKVGRINSVDARSIVEKYGMKWVPIIHTQYVLPDTVDELIDAATGTSELYDTLREGWVLRTNDVSFKAVSNDFLLKWKE